MRAHILESEGILFRDMRTPIRQGAAVNPADAGVELRGPAKWSDDEPVKLVWVQLACTGEFKGHRSGPFEMTVETFDECCLNFRTRGLPLAFDYEHASEADPTSGSIPTSGAPACGWIHDLVNRGPDGLWGLVEWLDDARTAIKAGKYAYISPALRLATKDGKTGKAIGARITSAALTNQPFLSQLPPLIAASEKCSVTTMALGVGDVHSAGGSVDTKPELAKCMSDVRAALGAHAAKGAACGGLHYSAHALLRCLDEAGGASMADADKRTLLLAEGAASRATLELRDAHLRIEEQATELRTLREYESRRDEADVIEAVDTAFRTYKDLKKMRDEDRGHLLNFARADMASFRKMYPAVDLENRHLLREVTPREPAREPPLADNAGHVDRVRHFQRQGMSLGDAQIAASQHGRPPVQQEDEL